MLGKNYHLKEQCLLAHFKIPSYWQAGIEMSQGKLLRADSCLLGTSENPISNKDIHYLYSWKG